MFEETLKDNSSIFDPHCAIISHLEKKENIVFLQSKQNAQIPDSWARNSNIVKHEEPMLVIF